MITRNGMDFVATVMRLCVLCPLSPFLPEIIMFMVSGHM